MVAAPTASRRSSRSSAARSSWVGRPGAPWADGRGRQQLADVIQQQWILALLLRKDPLSESRYEDDVELPTTYLFR